MSERVHGRSPEDVAGLLQTVELFEGLPPDDMRRIAGIFTGMAVDAGEVVFEEGDPGEAFYVVLDGAVEILKSRPDGTADSLAVRRAGDAFGEMALLDDAPRSATARAYEASQLMVASREGFRALFGGDTLALRMMQGLSRRLRALDVGLAVLDKGSDPDAPVRADTYRASRMIRAGLLPREAPRIDGFEVAAGTTTEEEGRGGSVWDWLDIGGRAALVAMDVRQDGFPPAYQLGVTRAVLRSVAGAVPLSELLARVNDTLAEAAVEGPGQYVDMGMLVAEGEAMEWAGAGRVPGGIIRRDGTFEELVSHGPPLGMLAGFNYHVQHFRMSSGDTAFALSDASQGLLRGAADLVAQLHGKPAGEVVATLHRAIRKAQGAERVETSVLYLRKH